MDNLNARRKFQRGWVMQLCSIAGLWLVMALLGSFFVSRLRDTALESQAAAGGLYVEGFLAPHARQFLEGTSISAQSNAELMLALQQPSVKGRILAFKLWNLEGKLVFSSTGKFVDESDLPQDIAKAIAGEVVAEIYQDGEADEATLQGKPLIEIHAPIFDAAEEKVIAVGEIYESATIFLNHRAQVESSIWLAVGLSTLGLTCLLLLLAGQRSELMRSLQATRATAEQNRVLKESADLARSQASQLNEDLLNRLGAELHDGPIQMLSLILLKQGKDDRARPAQGGQSVRELAEHTLADLRAISGGLVLPEITELTLEDALRLAVLRHEEMSGVAVKLRVVDLPQAVDQALKICCYRTVQEGLANAAKHGGRNGVEVNVTASDRWLHLEIRNEPGGVARLTPPTGRVGGLGLQGLRTRIAVFGGNLRLDRHPSGGATLVASIPLDAKVPLPE